MFADYSVAKQVLEAWGAVVTPLPTSHKEECDWLAVLDGYRLIVEEKMKLDSPSLVGARQSAFASGEVHSSTHRLATDNRISGVVRKAANQLASTACQVEHDSRILWFTGFGYDAEAKHLQLMATLYGSTRIIARDSPGLKHCYFFRNGDFYRFRAVLDGAVAAFVTGDTATVKLCLNPYAERWEALRDSPYAARVPNGLIDPIEEEREGVAYFVDGDVDRKKQRDVIAFLQKKYDVENIMNMDMGLTSAVIPVNR